MCATYLADATSLRKSVTEYVYAWLLIARSSGGIAMRIVRPEAHGKLSATATESTGASILVFYWHREDTLSGDSWFKSDLSNFYTSWKNCDVDLVALGILLRLDMVRKSRFRRLLLISSVNKILIKSFVMLFLGGAT